MAISAHILKIVENDPFLRLQMRAKEIFNRHQLFYTNKQSYRIFQEHLFGILRLRKYPTSLRNFFAT